MTYCVEFDSVNKSFQPGQKVLADVSLKLPEGLTTAVVGESGSGKTTLIKLLTRLYAPSEGRILLEGLDLKAWDIETLRQKIGVIFQDFSRYQLIVGENIGIGDVENIEARDLVEEAARQGMADVFVKDLPKA